MTATVEEPPLKVVRIIDRLVYGGPTRNVVFLTEGLSKVGFECDLITGVPAAGEQDMTSWAQQYKVEPLRVNQMSRELSIRDGLVILKLWRLLAKLRPDIVHTHKSKAGATGRLAAFLYRYFTLSTMVGRPRKLLVLHTFHGHVFYGYYSRSKTALFVQIERCLARLTDCIVTVSQQQEQEIRDVFRVGKKARFQVVPLGIDFRTMDAPSKFREAHGIGSQEFLVGAVGRLCEIKNFPLLLQALASALRTSESKSMHLAFIGEGQSKSELELLATKLGIGDRVTFAGLCEDVDTIYPEFDLAALSSLNEGTPLVLIEAMSHGRPMLTTEVGGFRDLVGEFVRKCDGFTIWEHGLSVRSGDVVGYAKALSFMALNRELGKQMGDRARNYVQLRFSRERLVHDTARLYRELWSVHYGAKLPAK